MSDTAIQTGTGKDERRWRSLASRSAAEADSFFYAVTSTGVVCRPDCPSRRPRRENVRFFDTLDEAFRSGYRACLRCKPGGLNPSQASANRIDRVVDAIHAGLAAGRMVSLAELAEMSGISPFHLQRSFHMALGVTPAQYARRARMERFSRELSGQAGSTVTEAMYAAGYQSTSRVYAPGNGLGLTPGELKRGARGEDIRYSIADSPLERMLVAATAKGICAVAFAGSDDTLLQELRGRFPLANLREDSASLGNEIAAVLAGLQEPSLATSLPLHVRATAFQQRVWQALQAIPRGETRTYAAVAAEIGRPSAARAVARACASNPVALLVPCHRVVGADGALTGYRWGVERKRKLLAMERGTATGE